MSAVGFEAKTRGWGSVRHGRISGVRRVRSSLQAIVAVVAGIAGLLTASAAPAQGRDPLYEAARKEGEVSIYQQGPAIFDSVYKLFEAKYPGIRVKLTRGRYELGPRIDAEIARKQVAADIFMGQTLLDFDRWSRSGDLTLYKPDGFSTIPAALRDKKGAFYAFSFVLGGIA